MKITITILRIIVISLVVVTAWQGYQLRQWSAVSVNMITTLTSQTSINQSHQKAFDSQFKINEALVTRIQVLEADTTCKADLVRIEAMLNRAMRGRFE